MIRQCPSGLEIRTVNIRQVKYSESATRIRILYSTCERKRATQLQSYRLLECTRLLKSTEECHHESAAVNRRSRRLTRSGRFDAHDIGIDLVVLAHRLRYETFGFDIPSKQVVTKLLQMLAQLRRPVTK